MFRRHHLAVLALGLAASPLAAQQSGAPLAPHPADWAAAHAPSVAVEAPALLDAPSATEAAHVRLEEARSHLRVRPSFPVLTALVGMVVGGAAGGSVMSRQCLSKCGVKAFYGALGGSTLGFSMGFTLGRVAEGGDPTGPPVARPAIMDN